MLAMAGNMGSRRIEVTMDESILDFDLRSLAMAGAFKAASEAPYLVPEIPHLTGVACLATSIVV